MEDLNKLRYYLSKRDEIYENNSENESINSDELLAEDDQPCNTELSNGPGSSAKENLYEDFTIDEIRVIEECDNAALKNALILNRKKKVALQKIAKRLNSHLTSVTTQIGNCKDVNSWQLQYKRHMRYRLGMPYFKDKDMYQCPYNEDYNKMKQNQELPLQSYYIPKEWTINDKSKLASTLYVNICEYKKAEIRKQIIMHQENNDIENINITALQEELQNLENQSLISSIAKNWHSAKILTLEEIVSKKNELRDNIADLQNQLLTSNDISYKKEVTEKVFSLTKELKEVESKNYIIHTVATWRNKIDWFTISCNDMERHTDMECKFMWEQYMNPKYNKESWTESENYKLIDLVQIYEMENWNAIAEVININKSAYQCCIHFLSKLWEKCRRDKWTKEEEEYLTSVVSICRIGDFIPWGKIAKFFEDRTRTQIYSHYVQCIAPTVKKGPFTLSEDILLTALLRKYQSISKASYYFPNRTLIQLRDRCKFIGDDNTKKWTFEDDLSILKHVEEFGEGNWKNIDIDKNAACIRHRYNLLKKWIEDHPGESIENVSRRSKSNAKRMKHASDKMIVDKTANILLEELKNGNNRETIFNIKYIQNVLRSLGIKEKKQVNNRKPRQTKTDVSSYIMHFFKYSYKFVGRNRIYTDQAADETAVRVKLILNTLGSKLKIPESNVLENHPLLDEFDVKILRKMAENSNTDNQIAIINNNPGTSTTNIKSMLNIPPEPYTVIGFRALMLHALTLKPHAAGDYRSIEKYLPEEGKYNIDQVGVHITQSLIKEQLDNSTNKEKILEEREMCRKRFQSLFKWPAIMSSPNNEPPENPFIDSTENTEQNNLESDFQVAAISSENNVNKKALKRGRPVKLSAKIINMLEAKKRKKLDNLQKSLNESENMNNE